MRQPRNFKIAIGYLLVMMLLFLGSSVFAEDENLFFSLKLHQPLELAPYNTQLFSWNNQLNALSIINGKILYFKETGSKWLELQRFGPHEINFTTFEIKDLNGDKTPEIIAGTEEPGLIYLYTYDNGQWSLVSYGKHVWSTINKIIIGNLSGINNQEFIVQNDEGYLFLLKLSNNNSLDLIWKSPNVWQTISNAVVADINNDSLDEVLVVYKTGGIAILKLENNAVVSTWENYPWGKILGLTVGDWDNDQKTEVIFSTSQKLLYVLGENGGQFRYEGQFSNFNRVIEKISFLNDGSSKALVTTDTAGDLKILQFDSKDRKWNEKFNGNNGRILDIIQPNQGQVILWSSNRNIVELSSYKLIPLEIIFQDNRYPIMPNAIGFNNRIYIAPKSFASALGFEISYDDQSQTYTIFFNERKIELAKEEPTSVWINGFNKVTLPIAPFIIDNELYLPLDVLKILFNLNLNYNSDNQTITIS